MVNRPRYGGRRRSAIAAAGASVAVCGAVACVGVAGAQSAGGVTIEVRDSNTYSPSPVDVKTGDSVTWDWSNATVAHNVNSTVGPAEDPEWVNTDSGFKNKTSTPATWSYTFTKPGVYTYLCNAHAGMTGEVRVTGAPVEPAPTPPPPTPTAPATPSPTPAPSAPPDDHTSTPAPGGVSASDAAAPAIARVRASGRRGVAKVTFRLSETATVTVRVSKGGKVLRTARLQVRAGTRTLTVRSATIKRGKRYRIALQARDASGNTSRVAAANLKIKRK